MTRPRGRRRRGPGCPGSSTSAVSTQQRAGGARARAAGDDARERMRVLMPTDTVRTQRTVYTLVQVLIFCILGLEGPCPLPCHDPRPRPTCRRLWADETHAHARRRAAESGETLTRIGDEITELAEPEARPAPTPILQWCAHIIQMSDI